MATRRQRWTRALFPLVAVLAVGCGSTEQDAPAQQRDRASSPDAPDTGGHGADDASGDSPTLIIRALEARDEDDIEGFVDLLASAAATCPDPLAAKRLRDVSTIAEEWVKAIADLRPKATFLREQALVKVDWEQLADACAQA